MPHPDAIVIGSGPNGLAAAITLARAGCSVTVLEAEATIGGGARSGELTLPGFVHDLASAIHPLAIASPFFRSLPLAEHGLEWVHPEAPLAHPLDDGTALVLERSVAETAPHLEPDAGAYVGHIGPLAEDWEKLRPALLDPFRRPRHPLVLARFGLSALRSADSLARTRFRGERARALMAGLAAHSVLPLERAVTGGFALVLALTAHSGGWPFPRGGAQKVADALASCLRALGGTIVSSTRVRSLTELPAARAVLCDLTPRQLLAIAGVRLPTGYRRSLERYPYGPGAFKLDWALAEPIPWKAEACGRAATIHLGGTLAEIAASERAVWQGKVSERPFLILAQPSPFDPTRAPAGKHTAWAYVHVPNAWSEDITERIEAQVERFAPGFRERILARSVSGPACLEKMNANLVGGDIGGGVQDLGQFLRRPTFRHHATPVPGLYLCSASTPPGPGVHGMCGYLAARRALREVFGVRES